MALVLKNRQEGLEENAKPGKKGPGRPKSKARPKKKAGPKATPKSQPRSKAAPKATPKSKAGAKPKAQPKAKGKAKATRQPKKRPAAAINAGEAPGAFDPMPETLEGLPEKGTNDAGMPNLDELPNTFARRAKPGTVTGLEKYARIVHTFRTQIQPLLPSHGVRTVAEARLPASLKKREREREREIYYTYYIVLFSCGVPLCNSGLYEAPA